MLDSERFLPGVPGDYVLQRLNSSAGNEVKSGKFWNQDSSAALAVNTFGWFIERVESFPPLPSLNLNSWHTEWVEVEYCARFPWQGGSHPWLDACVMTQTDLIGVESKRFEPFRDTKSVSFSDAYKRPVWGDQMKAYETLRDRLQTGEEAFRFLDAAQLVKHAFGLVTEGKRKAREPHLFYLFAEPAYVGTKPITSQMKELHRAEIACFNSLTKGAAVKFAAGSYREWLSEWSGSALEAHRERLISAFEL